MTPGACGALSAHAGTESLSGSLATIHVSTLLIHGAGSLHQSLSNNAPYLLASSMHAHMSKTQSVRFRTHARSHTDIHTKEARTLWWAPTKLHASTPPIEPGSLPPQPAPSRRATMLPSYKARRVGGRCRHWSPVSLPLPAQLSFLLPASQFASPPQLLPSQLCARCAEPHLPRVALEARPAEAAPPFQQQQRRQERQGLQASTQQHRAPRSRRTRAGAPQVA